MTSPFLSRRLAKLEAASPDCNRITVIINALADGP
jgi:hypothetical protein